MPKRFDPNDPNDVFLEAIITAQEGFAEDIIRMAGKNKWDEALYHDIDEDFEEDLEETHVTPLTIYEEERKRRAAFRPTRASRFGEYKEGYVYSDLGSQELNENTKPASSLFADFSLLHDDRVEFPTATRDPMRPRTVAAFYEPENNSEEYAGTVTVMFRDGTLYNYYDVSNDEWLEFRRAHSKGGPQGPISTILDSKNKGPANMTDIPQEYRQRLNFAARRAQIAMTGLRMPSVKAKKTSRGTTRKRAYGTIKTARERNKGKKP